MFKALGIAKWHAWLTGGGETYRRCHATFLQQSLKEATKTTATNFLERHQLPQIPNLEERHVIYHNLRTWNSTAYYNPPLRSLSRSNAEVHHLHSRESGYWIAFASVADLVWLHSMVRCNEKPTARLDVDDKRMSRWKHSQCFLTDGAMRRRDCSRSGQGQTVEGGRLL